MFKRLLSVFGTRKPSTGEMVAPVNGPLVIDVAPADDLIQKGNECEDRGDLVAAVTYYEAALNRSPGYAKAHVNLGNGYLAMGRTNDAVRSFETALCHDGSNPSAHFNLAITHQLRGQHELAVVSLNAALKSKPHFAIAHIALADSLDTLGNAVAAITHLRESLIQEPEHTGALFNLAQLLHRRGDVDEADETLGRCLALDAKYAEAWCLRGDVRKDIGRLEDAVEAYRTALRIRPRLIEARSNLLLTLNYVGNLSPAEIFEEHRLAGELLDAPQNQQPCRQTTGRAPDKKLKVGYVSGDFRNHPVSTFVEPVFANHDRDKFVVFGYSNSSTEDETTSRLKGLVEHWHDISMLGDEDAARLIKNNGIDILVDLSGHTGLNRLTLFARKPAPIQLTWLGYLNTTGLAAMDYRICDGRTDPVGVSEKYHTEELCRLPDSQWCYRPGRNLPEPKGDPPMRKNGYPTFGSFNNFVKISQSVVEVWSHLLTEIPVARLRIFGVPNGCARANLLQRFEHNGISRDRLELVGRLPYYEYFEAFNDVDVAVDTVPYNGGTTTCDSLWMGVPIVAVGGEVSVSRSGISILGSAGFPELIAQDPDDYLRIHQELIESPDRLGNFRKSAREKMRLSPLMDEKRFTRNLENAFQKMHASRYGTRADTPSLANNSEAGSL